jgi:hypothetical protein
MLTAGKLTRDWLAARKLPLKCPVCNGTEWQPNEHFVKVRDCDDQAPFNGKTDGVPLVLLTCMKCFAVLLLSAKRTGILP